ncbi:MAG: hypothetical protein KAG86_10745, partial [Gammaproteobacteria bacterium]|nr:hypothetical protein [Gammaproteobacteria bacterium]
VYPGVITVFRSSQHHQLEKKGVGHFAVPWSNFTEASLDDYVIPGTHSEMITGSSLRLLTKHLKACLNKVNEEKEVKAEC